MIATFNIDTFKYDAFTQTFIGKTKKFPTNVSTIKLVTPNKKAEIFKFQTFVKNVDGTMSMVFMSNNFTLKIDKI
jgi:hypothetical protein